MQHKETIYQARAFILELDKTLDVFHESNDPRNPFQVTEENHSTSIEHCESLLDDAGERFVTWIFKDGSVAFATNSGLTALAVGTESFFEFMELFVKLSLRKRRTHSGAVLQAPTSKSLH